MSENQKQLIPDKDWLLAQAKQHNLEFLLAHSHDGVTWGRFLDGALRTSDEVLPLSPPLRFDNLQQLRAFGADAELLLWRDGEQWRCHLLADNQPGLEAWPEDDFQLLWGTRVDPDNSNNDVFTVVSEGRHRLSAHAVPLRHSDITFDEEHMKRPLRLRIRHYLETGDDGFCRIVASRLAGLDAR